MCLMEENVRVKKSEEGTIWCELWVQRTASEKEE